MHEFLDAKLYTQHSLVDAHTWFCRGCWRFPREIVVSFPNNIIIRYPLFICPLLVYSVSFRARRDLQITILSFNCFSWVLVNNYKLSNEIKNGLLTWIVDPCNVCCRRKRCLLGNFNNLRVICQGWSPRMLVIGNVQIFNFEFFKPSSITHCILPNNFQISGGFHGILTLLIFIQYAVS